MVVDNPLWNIKECTTFAPATIASVINANVKRNPNPNPNPTLNPYPTPNLKPNHYPHSNSLLPKISWQEQLSPEQMSDHHTKGFLMAHQRPFDVDSIVLFQKGFLWWCVSKSIFFLFFSSSFFFFFFFFSFLFFPPPPPPPDFSSMCLSTSPAADLQAFT